MGRENGKRSCSGMGRGAGVEWEEELAGWSAARPLPGCSTAPVRQGALPALALSLPVAQVRRGDV